MHAFEGRAGGHLSTPIGAALGRRKEQVCTAGAPTAPRRCRDGGSLGPQGYVELRVSESGRMPQSPVRSAPAPGVERVLA
jgi:hypothetical protein